MGTVTHKTLVSQERKERGIGQVTYKHINYKEQIKLNMHSKIQGRGEVVQSSSSSFLF